jgi:uncharacterized protein YcfJ
MNKSMIVGVIAGVGVALAGGVAGFSLLGKDAPEGEQVAVAEPATQPQRAASQPSTRPSPAQTPAVTEECWDEEVVVQQDPKDRHAVAGTAIGAVVGGAIGKDVGDRDLTTAAGAAAGAYIGRRIQKEIQENRADERTVTTTERRCAPVGSR